MFGSDVNVGPLPALLGNLPWPELFEFTCAISSFRLARYSSLFLSLFSCPGLLTKKVHKNTAARSMVAIKVIQKAVGKTRKNKSGRPIKSLMVQEVKGRKNDLFPAWF